MLILMPSNSNCSMAGTLGSVPGILMNRFGRPTADHSRFASAIDPSASVRAIAAVVNWPPHVASSANIGCDQTLVDFGMARPGDSGSVGGDAAHAFRDEAGKFSVVHHAPAQVVEPAALAACSKPPQGISAYGACLIGNPIGHGLLPSGHGRCRASWSAGHIARSPAIPLLLQCAFSFAAKNWHQPFWLIFPDTISHESGGRNCRQIAQCC